MANFDHFSKLLLGGVSPEVFFQEYWERRPHHMVFNGTNTERLALLSPVEVDDLIARAVDISAAHQTLSEGRRITGNSPDWAFNQMALGYTLVLDSIEKLAPPVGDFCREISKETGFSFQANAYITPPNGAGFAAHIDDHDVFVLQLPGNKEWLVSRTSPGLLFRSEIDGATCELGVDPLRFEVRPGDVLYIPRGYAHSAKATSDGSIHLTIGAIVVSVLELIVAAVEAAVADAPELRRGVPMFGRLDSRELTQLLPTWQTLPEALISEAYSILSQRLWERQGYNRTGLLYSLVRAESINSATRFSVVRSPDSIRIR